MTRLKIERDQDQAKRNWRAAKRRKTMVLTAAIVTGVCLVLAYRAIRSLVDGDFVMPTVIFLIVGAVLFVVAVAVWQYLHPEPGPKRKRDKGEPPSDGPSPFNGFRC